MSIISIIILLSSFLYTNDNQIDVEIIKIEDDYRLNTDALDDMTMEITKDIEDIINNGEHSDYFQVSEDHSRLKIVKVYEILSMLSYKMDMDIEGFLENNAEQVYYVYFENHTDDRILKYTYSNDQLNYEFTILNQNEKILLDPEFLSASKGSAILVTGYWPKVIALIDQSYIIPYVYPEDSLQITNGQRMKINDFFIPYKAYFSKNSLYVQSIMFLLVILSLAFSVGGYYLIQMVKPKKGV